MTNEGNLSTDRSREILINLIIKRGWMLWLSEYEVRLAAEGWKTLDDIPHIEQWERYRSGVTPAEYIEEIRNGVWLA